MIKFDELPIDDRMIFFNLLASGKINPEKNKYMLSMATGKKYRIEVIDGEYYFEPCPIGYDKVNIKDEKAKKLFQLPITDIQYLGNKLLSIFAIMQYCNVFTLMFPNTERGYIITLKNSELNFEPITIDESGFITSIGNHNITSANTRNYDSVKDRVSQIIKQGDIKKKKAEFEKWIDTVNLI